MRVWTRAACAALLIAVGLAARAASPRFEPVGELDSLRDRAVSALANDARGFLWVGMPDGLQRFDGYRFRRYPLRDAAGVPVDQFVRALLADPRGGLWVAAGNSGLAWLDTNTGQWTRWARAEGGPVDARGPASNAVRALALAPDGSLWLGTQGGGLSRLDPQRQGFSHLQGAAAGLPDDRVGALLLDRQGTLWIGTWQGLVRKRAGSERIEPVDLGPGLTRPQITLLAETRDGRVLVGTGLGDLRMLAAESGHALPFAERAGAGDGPWPVLSMTQAGDDELWLGGRNGIERRRAGDGALIERLPPEGSSPAPVPRSEVRALLRDPAGLIWAGSYGSGLMRHVPPLPGLSVVLNEGERWRRFGDLDVRSVLQLADGRIWLGTQADGVVVLDTALQPLGEITGRQGRLGRIGAMAQTPDGIWLAAESELLRFDAQGHWRQTLGIRALVRRLVTGRDGHLWIATSDGLWRLRPGAAEPQPVMLAAGPRSSGEVNAVLEMPDGTLWAGGAAGLLRLREPGAARPVAETPATPGLVGRTVVGLAVDGQGTLWVDTSAGLHRLLPGPGGALRFEGFPAASGEDVIGVFGANLLADAQGRIWTHRGYFDPSTGQRLELGAVDGADIGTGWFRAYTRLADGRFLFGGAHGLLVLQPERFAPWAYRPPVVATELRLGGGAVLPLPAEGQPLVLAPGERGFSLGFAALDFSRPASIRYRYRLEGLDAGWLDAAPTARRAAYTNLDPGHYLMRVQGSNRLGDWSPHELRLEVRVQAAWWQQRWLQALAGLAALGLLLGAFRLRTRRLLQRQRVLAARVAEATAALNAKSAELEEASLTDPLTGLRNRRFLEQQLPGDVALAVRHHEGGGPYGHAPLAAPPDGRHEMLFFIIDVDNFKHVNDAHGHAAGDAVLTQMRGRLGEVFRASDYLVRWGGEEFLVVARETPRERAAELAERARQSIASQPFELGGGLRLSLTCSVGFVAFPLCVALPRALDWRAAVDLADAALYQAKAGGRDAWVGLLDARAASEAELRQDLRRPLADWAASGRLRLLSSRPEGI